ncbi:MAG: hypothetical protein BGO82_16820 [Devosia sp. 67-54]|uniref:hypothetical protein n=1 Tax=unclassified Devosia TaxID=196773 RepID=UPI00095954A4|nr:MULTISPECIES: hypothetical protein [unclassified Devosia]MBN9304039.1 hypothetical protein [Devosia sp.]OJX17880.1 MAG: hypothetical protein BGO82_16820 [Devosia sp. 67-54]
MRTKLLIGALALGSLLAAANVGVATAAPPTFQFGFTIGDPPPPPPPPGFGPGPGPWGPGGPGGPGPWGPGGGPHGWHGWHGPHGPPGYYDCISLRAIFNDLSDRGFGRFRNYRELDDAFAVDARRGMSSYRLLVDSCDGEIIEAKRLKAPF